MIRYRRIGGSVPNPKYEGPITDTAAHHHRALPHNAVGTRPARLPLPVSLLCSRRIVVFSWPWFDDMLSAGESDAPSIPAAALVLKPPPAPMPGRLRWRRPGR